MKKEVIYTFEDIKNLIEIKAKELKKVDAVVGIARGGMVPATLIAYIFQKPLLCFSLQSYNDKNQGDITQIQTPSFTYNYKSVLVVDDINDTGTTFNFVKDFFSKNYSGLEVNFLSIFAKENNNFPSADYCELVPPSEWIIFPWE